MLIHQTASIGPLPIATCISGGPELVPGIKARSKGPTFPIRLIANEPAIAKSYFEPTDSESDQPGLTKRGSLTFRVAKGVKFVCDDSANLTALPSATAKVLSRLTRRRALEFHQIITAFDNEIIVRLLTTSLGVPVTSFALTIKGHRSPPWCIARRVEPTPLLWLASPWTARPTFSYVRSGDRPCAQLLDIDYELADGGSAVLKVTVPVSDNGGWNYTVPATSFTDAIEGRVGPCSRKSITWNARWDCPNSILASVRFRVTDIDDSVSSPPDGRALNLAGSFRTKETSPDCYIHEDLRQSVYVYAFDINQIEMTKAFWDDVKNWINGTWYDSNDTAVVLRASGFQK